MIGSWMSSDLIAKLKDGTDNGEHTEYWPIDTVTIDNVDEAIAKVSVQ